jgi:hypothetical protein
LIRNILIIAKKIDLWIISPGNVFYLENKNKIEKEKISKE